MVPWWHAKLPVMNCHKYLTPLPIDQAMPEILQRIESDTAIVVVAAPGAGKTTRMPPAIYQSRILPASHPGIIVLQPRRIAARTVAVRIAEENNWQLGSTIGYQVRMDNCISQHTQITIMTEGILNRRLQSDPALDGIGAVILDEFHMRTIHVDQALAMLLDVRENLRPDLKLIISSATIDPRPVCDFISASCIEVPGRTYPVDIQYAPLANNPLEKACLRALEAGLQKTPPGHALVFLPGVYEIHKLQRYLGPFAADWGMRIYPLHGSLPLAEQMAAIVHSKEKKIILATNAAETSITVDGVTLVVDSGQVRSVSYDPERGLNRLATHRVSQASANQRAGRAGRTAAGLCIRLWDFAEWKHQPVADPPEITRVDLASLCLDVYKWNPAGFDALSWLTPPPPPRAKSAHTLLRQIGAVASESGTFQLSPLGHRMAELPLHPRLSRIVVAGIDAGHAAWAIMTAAILSDNGGAPSSRGDAALWNIYTHLEYMAEHQSQRRNTATGAVGVAGSVHRLFRQLCRACRQSATLPPLPPEDVMAGLLLVGFPDRVCMMDANVPSKGVMVGGVGVQIGRWQVNPATEIIIALDIQKNDDREQLASIHLAARLSIAALLNSKLPGLGVQRTLCWDDEKRCVNASVEARLGDRRIKSHRDTAPDLSAARLLARRHLQPLCAEMLSRGSPIASLGERIKLLGRCGGGARLPPLTAELLADRLSDHMSDGELRPMPDQRQIIEIAMAALPYADRRDLDLLTPTEITLASGKLTAIQYTSDGPILEARIADLLGTHASLCIANGRVPVVCRILGPNFRPVQVTADLAGFWRGSYHQIRKDMRARYPRHPWPEDPLAYVPPVRPRQ